MTLSRSLLALASAIAILVAAFAMLAAPVRAATLSEADQATIRSADAYLDQVRTLKAHFVQDASNGAESEGTLYIDRPGKLRLEYDPPSPILMVSDGDNLVYYDKSLQQVTYVDLDSTLAGVLVQPHVALNGPDIEVLGIVHQPGTARVTVTRRKDPSQGRITLVFTEKPFELRQWQVVDAQGAVTTVTLYDAESGVALDDNLFVFRDPRPILNSRPNR